MRVLATGFDLDAFFRHVGSAPARLLMLDYDGTLAPFRLERDQAVPYPGVPERLRRMLAAGHTRVVLVSGRTVHDVVRLVGLQPHPEIWGTHGWECLSPEGRYERWEVPAPCAEALEQARALFAERFPGRLEQKPASLAFHWRDLAPGVLAEVRRSVEDAWGPLARQAGLEVHPFDGGLELRIPGRSKASAVERLLAESGAGAASAYLGDDFTDEDAFGAIRGHGLGVLVRTELRSTAASLWLRPPAELLDFLNRWMAACQGKSSPTRPKSG